MSTFVGAVKKLAKKSSELLAKKNSELAEKSSVEAKVFSYNSYEVFSYKDSYKEDTGFRALWGLYDNSEDSITKRLKCWAEELRLKCRDEELRLKCRDKDTVVGELTVVIVYDGMPQSTGDTISVGDFVGPHDWALVASWSIYKNPCLQNLKLRILILDILDKSNNPSEESFAKNLPWIQDYRVVGSTKSEMVETVVAIAEDLPWLRQALPPECRDMEMFVKDLLDPKRVLTTYPEGDLERSRDIESTQNLWRKNLLKAGNRHSVANLVAPAILASGLLKNSFREKALKEISEDSLMRRALISTLREVGFLETSLPNPPTNQKELLSQGLLKRYCNDATQLKPTAIEELLSQGLLKRYCNSARPKEAVPPQALGDVFGRLENIRFVLVDDHFDRGYHHILGYTLFGENYDGCGETQGDNSWRFKHNHSLNCYSSLEWLLEYLENLKHPIDNWKQPRYLFDNKNAKRCDVLFLDLRLWEDESKESRRKVIQKIFCAAKRLLGCTLPKEVSPEFARAFEAAQDDPDKLEALTLLPLLLSHIDRTLPIVLFTSSHQRVVLEMLQNCPNVITSFAKPLISGYGEPITPSHSISDLEEAIEKAINLHEARIAWKRISELEPQQRSFSYSYTKDQNGVKQNVEGLENVNFGCKELRAQIGMLFERCLYTKEPFSLFEEIAKPWELLEELVVQNSPTSLPDNCQLTPPTNNDIGDREPVGLAWALKENRNAKTHGKLVKEKFDQDPDRTRQVLILQLLFLLDFLGRDNKREDWVDAWDDPQTLVCSSEKGLGRVLCNLAQDVYKPHRRKWLTKPTESALTTLWKTVVGKPLSSQPYLDRSHHRRETFRT